MKKTRFFLIAAVAALAMAFTSCGGVDKDKQGTWAPVKSVYVQKNASGETTKTVTETIDWEAKTLTSDDETIGSSYALSNIVIYSNIWKVGKSTAKLAKHLSADDFAAKGLKGIEWNDTSYDVGEENGEFLIGTKLFGSVIPFDKPFIPSEDDNFAFYQVYTGELSDGSTYECTIYFNIF